LGTFNDKSQYVVNQTRIQKGCLPIEDTVVKHEHLPKAAYHNLEVIVWLGKKIVFIKHPFPEGAQLNVPIATDYLIISNDAVRHLEEITSAFTFTELIIDSSNRYHTVEQLLREAEAMDVEAYAVSEQGAYVVNFLDDSHRFF
jgi:hypothetical protein